MAVLSILHRHTSHNLFWHLYHISTSDLALVHPFVDVWQLLQVDGLEWRLGLTTSEELDCLDAVLPVAHVAALYANHFQHRFEIGCLELGSSRETNHDDTTAWSDALGSLLERLLGGSDEKSSMRTKTVSRGFADIFVDVFGCHKTYGGLEVDRISIPAPLTG